MESELNFLDKLNWLDLVKQVEDESRHLFGKNSSLSNSMNNYRFWLYVIDAVNSRLEESIKSEMIKWELNEKLMKEDTIRPLTPKEDHILHGKHNIYYRIDQFDFIIYSQILLDQVAKVVGNFLGIKPILKKDPFSSFAGIRRFLLEPKNIPFVKDEEFASFIRNKTYWYEVLVRIPRNAHIIHPFPLGTATYKSQGKLPQLLRSFGEFTNDDITTLENLKKKYAIKHPNLNDVVPNVYEMINALLNPEIILEKEDLTKLENLTQKIGLKLSTIDTVAAYLYNFLIEFNGHLIRRLEKVDENAS